MLTLPACETLLLAVKAGCLHITLNRPEVKNAMSFTMVKELRSVFTAIDNEQSIRAVIIRGADHNLCAGGDIKDMAAARQSDHQPGETDPLAQANRIFGELLEHVEHAPQAVIVVAEGAVLGGGFGLVCVSDIAIAKSDTQFGLPETSLGITPAQIAPFIVKRIGLTQGRRLAVTGRRLNGEEARDIGLIHYCIADEANLQKIIDEELQRIYKTAPGALAKTKQLMLAACQQDDQLTQLLNTAAMDFASAARSDEGMEGMLAFMQKRAANWVPEDA